MKTKTNLTLVFGIVCLMSVAIVSCEKDISIEHQNLTTVSLVSKEDAMNKFSILLSEYSIICNNKSISGYRVKQITTGSVDMIILPVYE